MFRIYALLIVWIGGLFFSSPNYEKDSGISFLAVEIGLTSSRKPPFNLAVLSIPPCFLWHFCFTSSFSDLSISAHLFASLFVRPLLCSLTFTFSLPFHLFFPPSYSLQSPSHSWSGAVGSPLSPSIQPSTSHMPTALPLGHTSLLHTLPLLPSISTSPPLFYLWEYADGANPGKDRIFLGTQGWETEIEIERAARGWRSESARAINHGAVICPKKQSYSSKGAEEKNKGWTKGKSGVGKICITVSMQDLIGSAANNVAVLVLSFTWELQQQAGWRSPSVGEWFNLMRDKKQ